MLDIFTSRFTSAENFNFTRGLCLHKDYVAGQEFVAWKGGCCSGWGSLGPVLPFFLGAGLWAPTTQGLRGKDWDVCQKAGPGVGVGDSAALRTRGGEISTERDVPFPMGREEQAFDPAAATHPDAFPNQLTPMRDRLCLVDGGFAINSPFPLNLLPQRAVDLILSFDYSLEAPFEVRCTVGMK